MIKAIPTNIPKEVVDYVFSEMENYESSTNPRICIASNTLSKTDEIYDQARSEGSGNTIDYQIYKFDGVEYIYGFDLE